MYSHFDQKSILNIGRIITHSGIIYWALLENVICFPTWPLHNISFCGENVTIDEQIKSRKALEMSYIRNLYQDLKGLPCNTSLFQKSYCQVLSLLPPPPAAADP